MQITEITFLLLGTKYRKIVKACCLSLFWTIKKKCGLILDDPSNITLDISMVSRLLMFIDINMLIYTLVLLSDVYIAIIDNSDIVLTVIMHFNDS